MISRQRREISRIYDRLPSRGEAAQDIEGKDCIAVAIEWPHTETEGQSFATSLMVKAFQRGIELDHAYVYTGIDSLTGFTEIRAN